VRVHRGQRGLIINSGRAALLTLLSTALTACGGGAKTSFNNNAGASSVTLSGTVNYESVPAYTDCNGLNFAGTVSRPIRGATVQLLDAASAQLGSTVADASGRYSFAGIPANTTVTLRVRAELKQPGVPGWDVEVRDNYVPGGSDNFQYPPAGLFTRPLYVADSNSFSTGRAASLVRNMTVESGWGGTAYTTDRAAAPFAILDVIYSAMQFVRATDPDAHFPELDVFWSVNNVVAATSVDFTAGQLSTTSYYSDIDSLFVLGDDSDDTDEFDDHVIAHEWGHYFEDNLSRLDSVGGAHFLGESLIASLAFSEGWATALSAMILDDPVYCDTGVPGTSEGGGVNTETSSSGVAGWFNELSIITLIYDLWDTAVDGTDDGSIGFRPIYDVMVGPQQFGESWTSLFSFATELRGSLDAQGVALLDSQLDRANVLSGVDLDIWATSETNDANVPANISPLVLPLYTDYIAGDSPIEICVDSYLDGLNRHGNNPGEDRYLRITVPVEDEYDVSVVTTTPTPVSADPNDRDQSDPDIYIVDGTGPVTVGAGFSSSENFEPTFRTSRMFTDRTYVARVEDWRFDDAEASIDYPQRICFDVSLAPTP